MEGCLGDPRGYAGRWQLLKRDMITGRIDA